MRTPRRNTTRHRFTLTDQGQHYRPDLNPRTVTVWHEPSAISTGPGVTVNVYYADNTVIRYADNTALEYTS